MLATIEKIENVRSHPEAERLDVVSVLGFDCIVPKGKFQGAETIVFIQPDTVLPKDKAWAESYLKYAPTRVKATKLNSKFTVWSCGLVVTLDELSEFNLSKYKIGTDVSNIIGVTKYEAPIVTKGGSSYGIRSLPYGIPKTDENRYENLRDLPYGELVDVTRKVDGSSATFYYSLRDDKFGICSRSLDLKLKREFSAIEEKAQTVLYELSKYKHTKYIGNYIYKFVRFVEDRFDLSTKFTDNEFTKVAEQLNIEAKLKAFCQEHGKSLALRGEVYGNGINASKPNLDAKKPLGFALFSVYDIDTHEYVSPQSNFYFIKVAEKLDIPTVDVLESNAEFTPQLVEKYKNADGIEGVVINHSDGLKRKSFKILSLKYDSLK